MKGVLTLIKLHKKALDEKRRVLTNHEDQKARLVQSLNAVRDAYEKERKVANDAPEIAFSFVPFAEINKAKQEQLEQLIQEKQEQIIVLQDEIHENFSELKKYEQVLDQSIKRNKLKEKRLETLTLDEVAQNNFQRKKQKYDEG